MRRARAWGLDVPEPVAAGEFVGPGGHLQGFLAVEELHGMLPLHEAIPDAQRRLPAPLFARWKRKLIVEMARIARRLHDRAWFHKDFYLCHFYVTPPDAADPTGACGTVYLIDLHRLQRHSLTRLWWQVKDLAQLLFSTWGVAGITNRDRLSFLRSYLGTPYFGDRDRALVRAIVRKARRYARHNGILPASIAPARGKAA